MGGKPYTEERRRQHKELLKNLPEEKRRQWNENISKGKKGKSTKEWSKGIHKTKEHWEKLKESRQRNLEERKHTFYIVNDELLTGCNLVQTKKIKGSTIKETLAKYTPATQEEIEKWLSEHLGETLMELELMKIIASEKVDRMS